MTKLNNFPKNFSRLYILMAVSMPFVIAAIIWASLRGNYISAIFDSTWTTTWLVFILVTILKAKRRKADEIQSDSKKVAERKRKIVIERIFWSFILVESIAMSIWEIYGSSPPYLVLGNIWGVLVSTGHLFYAGLFTEQ